MKRRATVSLIGLFLAAVAAVTAYTLHHARPPSLIALPENDGQRAVAAAKWVERRAVHLRSVVPGPSDSDIAPLGPALDGVQVVALGEASHGSRELFQLKDRLIRYLVRVQGVRILAMEASAPAAEIVNGYVLHGRGDLRRVIGGLGFWTWSTEEIMATLRWMRSYDATQAPDRQVRFMGFDMQGLGPAYDSLAAAMRVASPSLVAELDSIVVSQERTLHAPESPLALQNLARTRSLVARLIADSARLRERLGQSRASRTLWYADLVRQFALVIADPLQRDSLMGANVLRIVRENPTERLILWAHDMHITRSGERWMPGRNMGSYLSRALGPRYYVLGLTFDYGAIRASDRTHGNALTRLALGPAREGSVESVLARAPCEAFVVDLRAAPDTGAVAAWLATPRLLRSIGAVLTSTDDRKGGFLEITRLRHDYDGIGFVRRSTPSRTLDQASPAN